MHDEAPSAAETDWRQVLALYDLLRYLASGPMVTLNRVVAVSMVHGPHRGLDQLAAAETDPALAGHHRVPAVRSHLLELADDRQAARPPTNSQHAAPSAPQNSATLRPGPEH